MADLAAVLTRSVSSFGEKAAAQTNNFRQVAAEQNRSISKITKDIAGHFVQQRGTLDNVTASNRQTASAIDSLGSKIENNSGLIRQSISTQNDIVSALATSNQLLSRISKDINTLVRASGGGLLGNLGNAAAGAAAGGAAATLARGAAVAGAFGALGVGAAGGLGAILGAASKQAGETEGATPGSTPSGGTRTPFSPAAATESASEKQKAIIETANKLGIPPSDLATVISYETSGTFSPAKWGGKGGRYLGLIQFGPEEQKKYGVHQNQSFTEQMKAVEKFLTDRGFKRWLEQNPNATDQERRTALYSTINAGSPGQRHWSKSDRAGQNVMTHTQAMFSGDHAKKAAGFLSGSYTTPQSSPGVSAAGTTTAPSATGGLNIAPGVGTAPPAMKDVERSRGDTGKPTSQTPAGATHEEAGKSQQQYNISNGRAQLKTQSGVSYEVDAKYAKNFDGFVKDLEAAGYNIRTISSYRPGATVKGSGKPSFHSRAMAIDINAAQNPHTFPGMPNYGQTDMPSNVGQIAAKHGLGWGGNWRSSKDTMHFSAGSSEGATVDGGKGQQQTDSAGVGSQQTGMRQGQTGTATGAAGMGGLGGIGMPFGLGGPGMLGGMGMGRMGMLGGLAGLAMGLGSAIGSAAASTPTPTTPVVPTATAPTALGEKFVSPFTGTDPESPAQFFEADKKLRQMMQTREIESAAKTRDANAQKPTTVNVTAPQQPAGTNKALINDQQHRDTQTTTVASWADEVASWLGIKSPNKIA